MPQNWKIVGHIMHIFYTSLVLLQIQIPGLETVILWYELCPFCHSIVIKTSDSNDSTVSINKMKIKHINDRLKQRWQLKENRKWQC